jgi:hypothetical protein
VDLGGARTVPGGRGWTAFKEEFTTAADQWWMAPLVLRATGKGSVWLKDLSLTEAAGGPELLWEADVNRPILGVYNQPDCFMLDQLVEAAEKSGVRLQLVLLTRDHYMRMLSKPARGDYDHAIAMAKRLLRYAVARWGCSTHVAAWEYFNEMDPGMPTERFYSELGETFEQIDVNRHIRATSDWSAPSKQYRHPKLDTADMHYYLRPADGEVRKDAPAAVLARWKLMQAHVRGRPLLFSEFGVTDDKWQRSGDLDKDKEFVHLHDALWASAMCGFASTVCHWYWDDIEKRDLYGLYRPISKFVADIPFTSGKLQPSSASCDKGLRVIGLQGDDRAYLWVSDPTSTWWKVAVEGVQPTEIQGATVTVEGLRAGPHRLQWWDTKQGRVVKELVVNVAEGPLRLEAPTFTRDIACKVFPAR